MFSFIFTDNWTTRLVVTIFLVYNAQWQEGGDQDMFQKPGKYLSKNETCPPYRTIDIIAAIFAIISTKS